MLEVPFLPAKVVLDRMRPLHKSGSVSVPITVTGQWLTVAQATVDAQSHAVVNRFGLAVDSAYTYDGSLLFRVTVNGSVTQASMDLQSFALQLGTIPQPTQTVLWLRPNETAEVQVRRVSGAGVLRVDGVLLGYYWPSFRSETDLQKTISYKKADQ